MIYTITFNPSLDLYIDIDDFKIGKTNRTLNECYHLGGKGLNVSEVLAALGIDSTAVTFTGGFVGEEINKRIALKPYRSHLIPVSSLSRINLKFNDTEINLKGITICEKEIKKLYDYLEILQQNDVVIISGKVNSELTIISYLCKYLHKKDVMYILDNYDIALDTLKYQPFLIKPNLDELHRLFNDDQKDISEALKELSDRGAKNVIVSMGKDGSMAVLDGIVYKCDPIAIECVNAVGSGDSMIAGFVGAYLLKRDHLKAYRLAAAAAMANAVSMDLPSFNDIKAFYHQISIKRCL